MVDDEENLRTTLCFALEQAGYRTTSYADGVSAWEAFAAELPDLVVLDILMPRMDGLELCRRIRSRSDHLPVIFLTSRDEEFDRVLGLELGGDDYLCKPFSMRELIARVKVLFRRMRLTGTGPSADQAGTMERGALVVDRDRYTVTLHGTPVTVTVTEFRILEYLALEPGIVRTREQLMDAAYPEDMYVNDRTIDCHIKRLRKKLHAVDPDFAGIDTIYGLGYRYQM